jgi:hypothetical protein
MAPTTGATRSDQSVWRVTTARRSRSARPALALCAALAALALGTLGIVLGRASAAGDPAPPVPPSISGDDEQDSGTSGGQRTEEGAVAAATDYLAVLSSRGFIADPAVRTDALMAIVVPADRDRLAAQAADTRDTAGSRGDVPTGAIGAAFGPAHSTAWRTAPLGWRIDTFTTERAVVEVWSVQVSAGAGQVDVPAAATWTTTRMPLQWAEGAWKLDLADAVTTAGPTPGMGPLAQSPDLEVIAADGQFEEYRHVAD